MMREECRKFKYEALLAKTRLQEAQAQSKELEEALRKSENTVEHFRVHVGNLSAKIERQEADAAESRRKEAEMSKKLREMSNKIALLEKWEEPPDLNTSISTLTEQGIRYPILIKTQKFR